MLVDITQETKIDKVYCLPTKIEGLDALPTRILVEF